MTRIQMPSSYAVVTEEEKSLVEGGGAFKDAWNSFTDHLHFNDFFFGGGLLSVSISFVPMLLFNVVKTGFIAIDTLHQNLFGSRSKAATDIQNYSDDMQAISADIKSKSRRK